MGARPGDSLLDKIGEGLNAATYFCIILSVSSAGSNWCKTELREALINSINSGKNNVIVVKYGKVSVPPFLKDNLYIEMPRYTLRGVLYLASRIHRVSPKAVDKFIHAGKLDIDAIANFILVETFSDRIRFGYADWDALSGVLGRRGIRISDHIDVFDRMTGNTYRVS